MVIPWVGFPLGRSDQAARADRATRSTSRSPRCSTRSRCRGSSRAVLDWPYVEGLRIDEAMHPLTILAVGLYGEALPNQDGAPVRLVVPWKYGFKSIKSIVKIRFVEKQPPTTWNRSAPQRVRLLLERESRRRSPALEPGDRAAHRRAPAPRHADVQRLREQVAGLYAGHGPREELLGTRASPRPLPMSRVPLRLRLLKLAIGVAALGPRGARRLALLRRRARRQPDRRGAEPARASGR